MFPTWGLDIDRDTDAKRAMRMEVVIQYQVTD